MKHVRCLAAGLLLTPFSVFAQEATPAKKVLEVNTAKGTIATKELDKAGISDETNREAILTAQAAIMKVQPAIPGTLLDADAKVVGSVLAVSLKGIAEERGFSEVEARAAVLWSWKHVRTKELSPKSALTASLLMENMRDMGKLSVNSIPKGASIRLDDTARDEPTNAILFPRKGRHRVVVQKKDLAPATAVCEVRVEAATTFDAVLRPQSSSATCK